MELDGLKLQMQWPHGSAMTVMALTLEVSWQ
jgi:hypothetical protein